MAFGDFTVTRASTKLRIGSNGLYGSVANNVPAFEFNTDGTYRGLLVEPGATNLAVRSQEFGDVAWTKTESTVVDNATTSPDGATTADKLRTNTNSAEHSVTGNITFVSGTVYTASCYFKAGEIGFAFISFPTAAFGSVLRNYINLSNGATSLGAGVTGSVLALPNGWYRFAVTATATGNAASNIRIGLTDSISSTTSTGANATDGIFMWQAQFETGSVATSPIVTTAGTASRVADVVSLTGASSLIGQSAGTLYAEIVASNFNSTTLRNVLSINDGTTQNRITVRGVASQDNRFETIVVTSNSLVAQIAQGSNNANGATIRLAVGYALNDIALYANGSSVGTDTSATIPACSRIDLGNFLNDGQFVAGHIRSVALFPTRLSNATLASITA
jgi:hypothetical protein